MLLFKALAVIMLAGSGLAFEKHDQQTLTRYHVWRDGERVGDLRLYHHRDGNTTSLKIESEVKTKFIVGINVKSVEESKFVNGKLVYSSINRIVNGNEKMNRIIRASGNGYTFTEDKKTRLVAHAPILHNLLMLYTSEPVNVSRLYSENHQKYVEIEKVANQKYKVSLPNGNYNYYSYANGICTQVDIHTTLYTIQFKLAV